MGKESRKSFRHQEEANGRKNGQKPMTTEQLQQLVGEINHLAQAGQEQMLHGALTTPSGRKSTRAIRRLHQEIELGE